jgi:CheY-like chemotaxis protein
MNSSPHKGLRVMVVDDNVDTARILAMLLRSEGHDASALSNGKAALDAAKSRKPDVILLDLGLPGMDGLEVCRRLRQDREFDKTLLVALTGYGQEEDKQRSFQAGFDAHLVKPVGLSELEELLAQAAARKAE